MSTSDSGGALASTANAPDEAGKFSLSEDWLAVVVGLVLLGLILTRRRSPRRPSAWRTTCATGS